MKHYSWKAVTREQMNPLFARQVVHGEHLTLARVHLQRGCQVPMHSHENEQISHVIEGRLRFEVGGEEQVVGPGEMIQIPPQVPHLAEALDDCICLDIFTPCREDWKRGEDAYLRR